MSVRVCSDIPPFTLCIPGDISLKENAFSQVHTVRNVNHGPTTAITPLTFNLAKIVKTSLRYAGTAYSFIPYISTFPPLLENYNLIKNNDLDLSWNVLNGGHRCQNIKIDAINNLGAGTSSINSHSYQDFAVIEKGLQGAMQQKKC